MKALDRSGFTDLLRSRQGEREQKDLAAELGISAQHLSSILRGKADPGAELLERMGLEKRIVYVRKV